MADVDVKVSDLPEEASPSLDHTVHTVKGGVSTRMTVQQIANLVTAIVVDGAPETLDTLKELATALDDDDDFAASVMSAIDLKLPKDTSKMRYLGRRYITVSDPAFAYNVKATFARVFLLGGGGAGGYVPVTTDSRAAAGSGGNSGAWLWKDVNLTVLGLSPTAAITIGAGGTSTTSSSTGGSPTTYDDGTNELSANGGKAGSIGSETGTLTSYGGDNPEPQVDGDLKSDGSLGAASLSGGESTGSGIYATAKGGHGADSPFGTGGGSDVIRDNVARSKNGFTGSGKGSGGSGGASLQGGSAASGGAGTQGLAYIDEWGE